MSLEYQAKLSEDNLLREIAERMKKRFPTLSWEESYRLADNSLAQIRTQGNFALYEGLVSLGEKYALLAYEKSGSEGHINTDYTLG